MYTETWDPQMLEPKAVRLKTPVPLSTDFHWETGPQVQTAPGAWPGPVPTVLTSLSTSRHKGRAFSETDRVAGRLVSSRYCEQQ